MLLRLTRLKLDGSVEKELFDASDAVREAVEAVQPGAQEKALHLECSGLVAVRANNHSPLLGNALSFKEAITNLLLNAIKYTPPRGTVSVRTETRDNSIVIEVADTGIGVPPEEQDRIFEEFYRASNARQMESDGDGLGLSLVKRVIEMHGGSISFQSQLGAGTTFHIVLPRGPARIASDRPSHAREVPGLAEALPVKKL
jgi:signal transduction histidine kinase